MEMCIWQNGTEMLSAEAQVLKLVVAELIPLTEYFKCNSSLYKGQNGCWPQGQVSVGNEFHFFFF